MNLFFSGSGKGLIELDERLGSPRHRLFSCHGEYYSYAYKTGPLLAEIDDNYEIMLDSGAFTAWTKGQEISLEKLIETYSKLIDHYGCPDKVWLINLDKIPGSPGVTASTAQIDEAIKISDDNFQKLVEVFGHRVIPVFHQNESQERLAEVCAMSDYICVSPRNDLGEKFRTAWAKETHRSIPDNVRTHGLATTGYAMMSQVPWHSVDSATWLMLAAYGHIYINHELRHLSISDEQPNRHKKNLHFINISKSEQDELVAMMESRGFTYEELRTHFIPRSIWNRLLMSEVTRGKDKQIVHPAQQGLFEL